MYANTHVDTPSANETGRCARGLDPRRARRPRRDRGWSRSFAGVVVAVLPLLALGCGSDGGGAGGEGGRFGLEQRPVNSTCRPPSNPNAPARLLSETGCADPADAKKPAPGLIPYDVRSPLWSDGADKQRFLALPEGGKIKVKDCRATPGACQPVSAGGTPQDDGHWELPVGTVLVKSFAIGGRLIETRLLVRVNAFTWKGYSYEWNAAQTDAEVLPDVMGGVKKPVPSGGGGTQLWHFPSRAQCLQCHHDAAGISLGLTTAQLDRDHRYPSGVTSNQIDTLVHIGLFDAAPPDGLTPLPTGGSGDAPTRARGYLHANCANCHRPGGSFEGIDLRFDVPLERTGLCNQPPEKGDLGVAGALRLVPGDPGKSLLTLRMRALQDGRMPQIGTSVLDSAGVEAVEGWIRSIATCP